MIYPNKHLRFEESILFKSLAILEASDESVGIHDLFGMTKNKFDNPDEFVYALDVLFILGMIEIDFETEIVNYVTGN